MNSALNYTRYWLIIVLALCLMIVMLGGATRLTGSGLSITEWQPIHGVIPPLNQDQWQAEFDKYKQISQYVELHQGMDLPAFKSLYWWEWSHRILARLIGLVALLPFIFSLGFTIFSVGGCNIFVKEKRPLYFGVYLTIPLLIAIQGAIGWWMVYSGLAGSSLTSVSQYRLAIHMVSASLIILLISYILRGLYKLQERQFKCLLSLSRILSFLILIQIYLGSLVAGLHAGLSYNSWPLMDGQLVPSILFPLSPWWHSLFEDVATVQFIHRCFAYLVVIFAAYNLFMNYKIARHELYFKRALIMFFMVMAQAGIGIITLLSYVPISLGLLHQFFALILLVYSVINWRDLAGH